MEVSRAAGEVAHGECFDGHKFSLPPFVAFLVWSLVGQQHAVPCVGHRPAELPGLKNGLAYVAVKPILPDTVKRDQRNRLLTGNGLASCLFVDIQCKAGDSDLEAGHKRLSV